MEDPTTPGLDVEPDPTFVVRAHRVARAGRWVIASVIALAALGVFGGAGPLVSERSHAPGGLGVEYDRFGRLDAPLVLTVSLPPGDSAFALTGDFASSLAVEAISPAPVSEAALPEATRYVVSVRGGVVTFHVRPERFGLLTGAVRLDDGSALGLQTVVYP